MFGAIMINKLVLICKLDLKKIMCNSIINNPDTHTKDLERVL